MLELFGGCETWWMKKQHVRLRERMLLEVAIVVSWQSLSAKLKKVTEPLDASVRNKLNVIRQQLEGKLSILNGMNKDILEHCDPGVIVTKIEESDAIVTKVISCKLKIDELLAVTSSSTSAHPSTTPVTPTTIQVVTSKPHLPKFNGDVTKWK